PSPPSYRRRPPGPPARPGSASPWPPAAAVLRAPAPGSGPPTGPARRTTPRSPAAPAPEAAILGYAPPWPSGTHLLDGGQGVDRRLDRLPRLLHPLLAGRIVKAQALAHVGADVRALKAHFGHQGVVGRLFLLPLQVLLHGETGGKVPFHQVIGLAGLGLDLLQLGPHQEHLLSLGYLESRALDRLLQPGGLRRLRHQERPPCFEADLGLDDFTVPFQRFRNGVERFDHFGFAPPPQRDLHEIERHKEPSSIWP